MTTLKKKQKKQNIANKRDMDQLQTVFQDYLSCIADCFEVSYDDRKSRPANAPSLRDVCAEFSISIPKARKLLITAGMYSTKQSRRVEELLQQGKSVEEIIDLTGLKKSSINAYIPYQYYSYYMDEASRQVADSAKYRRRQKAVRNLQKGILEAEETLDDLLWHAVVQYQHYPFHTSSGKLFDYIIKRKKNAACSEMLVISYEGENKLLPKRSVLRVFHNVLDAIEYKKKVNVNVSSKESIIPTYAEPEEMGRIFGVSYIYSMFWKFGVIRVPDYIEKKLKGLR